MPGCARPEGPCQYALSVRIEPMPDVLPAQHELSLLFTNRTTEMCEISDSPRVRLTGPRRPGATYADPTYELPTSGSSKSVRLKPLEEGRALLTFVSPSGDASLTWTPDFLALSLP